MPKFYQAQSTVEADTTTITKTGNVFSLTSPTTYNKLLGTATASGACAVLSVTGLDLNTDKSYRIVGMVKTIALSGDVGINWGANLDYTATHYIDQQIAGKDAGAVSNTGTQANQSQLARTFGNACAIYIDGMVTVDVSGYPVFLGNTYSTQATPAVNLMLVMAKKVDATTNVTSLQLWNSAGDNKIDTASYLNVYGCS